MMIRSSGYISGGKRDIPHWIDKWKKEIIDIGYIENEAEVYTILKDISEEEDPIHFSTILTLLAKSRNFQGDASSIITAWLEKVITLDPNNQYAKDYLLKDQWKTYSDKLEGLNFPVFRETDNRTSKKKMVDVYLDICRQFLSTADETLDELNKIRKLSDSTLVSLDDVQKLFTSAVEEVGSLLKAVTEFGESLSGVFYASVHYENIKKHIENIQQVKEDWLKIFLAITENNVEKESNPLESLNRMIGLHSVKERVNDFYTFLRYQKSRVLLGFQSKDELSLNMILTGNPGTGKTTLARQLAKIYYDLGVLPREEVIETNRSQLVGSFIGQTEENVQAVVKKAVGGVLFIDEAYSLKREGQSGNDYGQAAIDTLVSLMTSKEFGGKFAVILAGYPEEMRQFIEANTGLRSRFPQSNFIHLPDYSMDELIEIAEQIAKENDYILTDEAKIELTVRLQKEKIDETFGNARTVKNIVLDAIFRRGSRHIGHKQSILRFSLLEQEDFLIEPDIRQVDPNNQLKNMIGLESVKREVQSLMAFVKIQQLRRENGLPDVPIQVHAVFSGNPGTGKTTVAKIYSELLKEYGILKRGHLIVTSRSDFIAGYVGQTAIKTKKKIREALGGVLFIDEAYSLLSQSIGDFGKEMIDTLVDEMTKHNENLVVILAGYPNEMDKLLESNPGLRSRFKKFFHFPDYSTKELVMMMEKYGAGFEYHLTEESKEYLQTVLSKIPLAGNGRFATNLMDEAIQAQALRLVTHSSDEQAISPDIYIQKVDVEQAIKKVGRGEE